MAGLVILLVLGGGYLISVTPVEVEQRADIANLVEEFGKRLQEVSLLAPADAVAAHMRETYAPYVTEDVLASWTHNPLSAPGRLTSSPWPDRIDITAITRESDSHYSVEGEIIEITTEGGGINEEPTVAIRRPVSISVEWTSDGWRITKLSLGMYPGDGEWVLSKPDRRGIQFMYPRELLTTYISATEWPPKVMLAEGDYSCADADKRVVGDRVYCIISTLEGAAGSAYRTYEYISQQGDVLAHVNFTLRFPQCGNYDEPERNLCAREQASFDIDGLVDRIVASIRML